MEFESRVREGVLLTMSSLDLDPNTNSPQVQNIIVQYPKHMSNQAFIY